MSDQEIGKFGKNTKLLRSKGRLRVFLTNVDLHDDHGNQPALMLGAIFFGVGRSYLIPLSNAWQYADEQEAFRKCLGIADHLYQGQYIKQDVRDIMDAVLDHLVDLVGHAPEKAPTQKEIADQMIRDGLKVVVKQGGDVIKTLVDAT